MANITKINVNNDENEYILGTFSDAILMSGENKTLTQKLVEVEENSLIQIGTPKNLTNKSRHSYIKLDGTWSEADGYFHSIASVNEGGVYKIVAKDAYNVIMYFLTDEYDTTDVDYSDNGGVAAPIVQNTERITIPAGQTLLVKIPTGCSYLYFYGGHYSAHQFEQVPSLVVEVGNLKDGVLLKSEQSLTDEEKQQVLENIGATDRFVHNENLFALTEQIYNIEHPYYEEPVYELQQDGSYFNDYGVTNTDETSITKNADNSFTFNKISSNNLSICFIGPISFNEDGHNYVLEFDYSINNNSLSGNTYVYVREGKTVNDYLCGYANLTGMPSSGHSKITIKSSTNSNKYIIVRSNQYYNNTIFTLSNISLYRSTEIVDNTSIKEKFDSIDNAIDIINSESEIPEGNFIKEICDFTEIKTRPFYITNEGLYSADSSYKHSLIGVSPGDYIKVKAQDDNFTYIAFLENANYPVASEEVPIVTGTTRITLAAGKSTILTIPEGTNCLFIYRGNTENRTPESLIIYRKQVEENHYFGKEITSFTCNSYRPQSSGTITTTSNKSLKSYIFKVCPNRNYVLDVSNSGGSTYVGFMDDIPAVGSECAFQTFSTGSSSDGYTFIIKSTNSRYILFNNNTTTFQVSMHETLETTIIQDDNNVKELDDLTNVIAQSYFEEQDILSLTKKNYSIDGVGYYQTSTTYKRAFFQVVPNAYIKMTTNSEHGCTFGFLSEDVTPVASSKVPFLQYTAKYSVSETDCTFLVRVPQGANYMYVYLGSGSAYAYAPSYLGISKFSSAGSEDDTEEIPAIVKLNDVVLTKRILSQISSMSRYSNVAFNSNITHSYPPLMLLHFSDLHGNMYAMQRINQYRDYYSNFIDDTIHTGDLATNSWSFDDSFWTNDTCGDILNAIGNHDTLVESGSTDLWHEKQGIEAYNRYFAPFINNWNVTQPTDASTEGKCYYYKDYSEKYIRLVVIDPFNTDADYRAAQYQWFQNVLADAITNELSVVIGSHFGADGTATINCPFNKLGANVSPDTPSANQYVPFVTEFIKNGGDFICWLIGHSHYGRVYYYQTDEIVNNETVQLKQLFICVPDAARSQFNHPRDNSHTAIIDDDPRTADSFNIVAIDTYFKKVTLFRVGSDYDKFGRHVGTCCLDYKNCELINYS